MGALFLLLLYLTAGHCILLDTTPSQYRIMAGSTLRLGDANQQLRNVYRLLRHPLYGEPNPLSHDVALIYWEQPLTFGPTVRAIRLPPQGRVAP